MENQDIIQDIADIADIEEEESINVDAYLSKFEKIATELGVTTKDMEKNVIQKVQEIKKSNNLAVQNAAVTLETLQNDFQFMRQNLLENIKSSQEVLSQFSSAIVAEGTDVKPTLLSAYSELVESCNSSIKLMSGLYKDISDTYIKIKKLEETKEKDDNGESNNKVTNNLIIMSTQDLLNKISEK